MRERARPGEGAEGGVPRPVYPDPLPGTGHHDARQVPVLLHRARDAMAARMRTLFDPFQLTDAQWRVLRLLSIVEEVDTAELANRAFLLGPSLSRIVRDLTERGLIRRRLDDDDARRSLHAITPEGMVLIEQIMPQFDPLYDQIEQTFGVDLATLNTLLIKLAATLAAPTD